MKDKKRLLDLAVLLIFICIVTSTISFMRYLDKRNIKIQMAKNGLELVTVWTDQEGVVIKSDREMKDWREKAISKPLDLKEDDNVTVYNVYTDSLDQDKYQVIKIERED